VRVKHDRAILNIAIFLKQSGHVTLGEARMDASNEEVGTRVDCAFFINIFHPSVARRWWRSVAAIWRSTAVAILTVTTRRGRSVTAFIASIVFVARGRIVKVSHGDNRKRWW
jgi:hypothetical protein